MRRTLFLGLFILLLGAGALGFFLSREAPPDPRPPFWLGSFVGSDLERTAIRLGEEGFEVTVHRPALTFVHAPRAKTFTRKEQVQRFERGKWNHPIAGQRPDAGVAVPRGSKIILVAGSHHDARAGAAWFSNHPEVVRQRGDAACVECHGREACEDCHQHR